MRLGKHMPSAQCGFAYLWVLLLVAFMGIALSTAVEIDSTAVQRDREKQLISIGNQFRQAIEAYYLSNKGGAHVYPASLNDLLRDNRSPGVKRYLRKIFVDPMTGKAEWGLITIGGRIVGINSLSEKTPIKQDGFEQENISLRKKKKYSEWQFTYPADMLLNTQPTNKIDPNEK